MWKFFVGEKIKVFLRGAVPGFISGWVLLFGGRFSSDSLAGALFTFFLKAFATFVLAFASGLASVIAAEAWKFYLKPQWLKFKKKFSKSKRNNNDRSERQKRA